MTCSSCTSKVESHLSNKPGITKVIVNLMTNVGKIEYLSDKIGPREIVNEIENLGFTADILDDENSIHLIDSFSDVNLWKRRFYLSVIFTVPLVILGLINDYAMDNKTGSAFAEWIIFLLATPIHFYCGFHFHYSAVKSLKNFYADMNVLISLATNCAYVYSVLFLMYATFITPDDSMRKYFFQTSSMIITFMNLGKYLESIAKKKTSNAISELVQLQAKTATLVKTISDGDNNEIRMEEEVKIELVQKGDILKVHPGDSIPVDGICIDGGSNVDESMITGEDNLISKSKGDSVIGGTLNHDGVIYMKVLKVGSSTMLSQIIKLVKESQNSKVPIQKYADKLSKVFIPIVIALSFATFLCWYFLLKTKLFPENWIPMDSSPFIFSLRFGISVLIICCPCALSLATPTAIMVACGVGAKLGVLIKSGESLESAHQVTCVCFDKTNTITIGKPDVLEYHMSFDSIVSQEEFFSLVYSSENNSQHPLAKSLSEFAKSKGGNLLNIKNFVSITGKGIECQINEKKLSLGSESFLFGVGIDPEKLKLMREKITNQKKTNIFVAYDQQLIGCFAMSDNIKQEAKKVIQKLKSMKIKTILLSGDRKESVDHVANQIGINIAISDLLPAKKLDIIKYLQSRGYIVAMVGDGINDAPSLAQSDVGIAIGAGSEVALESSDIVLVKSDLTDVITAIELSKTTFARIKLNHFWALGYNVILIPCAMGLLYPTFGIIVPPILAAIMMSSSSLIVLGSSLLLRLYKKPKL
jgi:P-type Cu+ transporter